MEIEYRLYSPVFFNANDLKNNVVFLESTKLPSQDIFGKSLYTFYIGQNDFTSNLAAIGIGGVKQYLPQVVSQIAGTIKVNYLSCNKFCDFLHIYHAKANKNDPDQYLSCYLIGWKGSPLATVLY